MNGPLYDHHMKIVLPHAHGGLLTFGTGPRWYADWLAQAEDERGSMRTFTVRDVRGTGADARVVIDLVLHLGHVRSDLARGGLLRRDRETG